ncbi:MAG: adenylate kinase family protein [Promethearchaeota archaeon]
MMKRDDIEIIVVSGKSGAGKQPRIDVLKKEFNLKQLSTGNIFRNYLKMLDYIDLKVDLSVFWNESNDMFITDEKIREKLFAMGLKNRNDMDDLILAIKAKFFINSGKFVPDTITNQLFKQYFKKYDYKGAILDGYPRTVTQARFLLDLLKEKKRKIAFVLIVENDDDTIIKRITGRRICPNDGSVYHLVYKPPKDGKYCIKCGAEVIQRSDDNEENIKNRLNEYKQKTLPALKVLEENGIPILRVPGNLPVFTDEKVRESVLNALSGLIE